MCDTITGEELNDILIENPNAVILVNYAADYIGESKMLDNVVNTLSRDYDDSVQFYRIDCDENNEHVTSRGIYQIPTVVIYSGSELVHYGTGLQSRYQLAKILDKLKDSMGEANY